MPSAFEDPLPADPRIPAGSGPPGGEESGETAVAGDGRALAAIAVLTLIAAVAVAIAVSNLRRADDWQLIAEGRADRILALETAIATSETDVDELLSLVDDLADSQAQAGDLGALAADEAGIVDLRRLAALAQAEIGRCSDGVTDLIDIIEGASGYEEDRAEYADDVANACRTARSSVLALREAAA